MTREYKHPEIDHTFIIEKISSDVIIIDGIKVRRSDVEWIETMANCGGGTEHVNINQLSLPFLQSILQLKQ